MATDKNFIVKHGLEVGGVNIVDSSGILSQSLITSVPSGAVASTQSVGDSSTALATTAYVRGEIDALINSAPGTLNTLDELAAAINDDAAFNTTLTNAVALKAPLASPTFTGNIAVGGTVDGRNLATDGTKLDGVEASADVTDTANVTSSGALMDSEVTNLAQVKAFDSSDYATAAQGTTADAALPKAGGTLTGNLTLSSTTPTVDIIAGANEDASLRIRENGTGIVGAELIYDGGVNEFQFKIGNNSANTAFTIARDTGQTTFAQNATFSGSVTSPQLKIEGTEPLLFFNDTTTGHDDWKMYADWDQFQIQQYVNDTTWTSRLVFAANGNATFSGSVISTGLTAKVAQTANTVMEVAKITTSGSYTSSGSPNAGGALTFGQYDDTYPAWNLSQIASVRNGSGWHGDLVFYINNGTSQTSIYERMRLSSNGNLNLTNGSLMVGATTAPNKKLHIKDASNYQLQIQGDDSFWNIGAGWSGYYQNSFLLANNTGDKLVIDPTGKVGIGISSPTQKLDVAGTALVENAKLKAIAASNTDTAVDVFVYDTRKDSDGGAWRKRTQHTSWYNEALNTSTRGARKEFPSVAVIVLESNKTVIYDGDDPDMPMWMTFINAGGNSGVMVGELSNKCVTMLNGNLGVGSAPYDFYLVNFIKDKGYQYSNNVLISGTYKGDISTRNVTTMGWIFGTVPNIVGRTINDVAMTVLPNAPIDADTGLPVPTIAVATGYGVSVIKDNGSVVDITAGSGSSYSGVTWVDITKNNYLIFEQDNSSNPRSVFHVPIPAADRTTQTSDGSITDKVIMKYYANGSHLPYPCFNGGGVIEGIGLSKDNQALRSAYGDLTILEPNVADPEQGKVAYIASDYNTGWMNGDIKLATLSDTDTTTPASTNLVTNGTFASASNWTGISGASTAITGGAMVFTNGGGYGGFYQSLGALTAGKSYTLSFDVTSFTTAGAVFTLADTAFGVAFTGTGSYSFVTAPIVGTDPYIRLYATAGGAFTIDNVSVVVAESDRSVNGNGLQVFGTLSKDPVATGADLVGYSGWSASNYLAQPYNSDLDFGTGDFSYMGWVKWVSGTGYLFDRADTSGNRRISVYPNSNGAVTFYTENGYVTSAAAILTTNVWAHLTVVRRSGLIYGYHNGVQVIVPFADTGSKTSADGSALLKAGVRFNNADALNGSIALLRASATVPTPEQIKKMYNDEKHLFTTNTKATLYGTSNAVTALAYDDDTELLHVGTSAGRSVFQGLNRVDNTTDAVGAAISASNGLVAED